MEYIQLALTAIIIVLITYPVKKALNEGNKLALYGWICALVANIGWGLEIIIK